MVEVDLADLSDTCSNKGDNPLYFFYYFISFTTNVFLLSQKFSCELHINLNINVVQHSISVFKLSPILPGLQNNMVKYSVMLWRLGAARRI